MVEATQTTTPTDDGAQPSAGQNDNPTPAKAGRKPRAAAESPAVPDKLMQETVTYTPGPEGPAVTKWAGHTFHANVPKIIDFIEFGDPEKALHPMKALVEKAKLNPYFHVGEFDPRTAPFVPREADVPKTAEQYRQHVVGWVGKISSEGQLDHKWMSEEALRQACGVGTDDLDWLNTLIAPKRAELHKAAMVG